MKKVYISYLLHKNTIVVNPSEVPSKDHVDVSAILMKQGILIRKGKELADLSVIKTIRSSGLWFLNLPQSFYVDFPMSVKSNFNNYTQIYNYMSDFVYDPERLTFYEKELNNLLNENELKSESPSWHINDDDNNDITFKYIDVVNEEEAMSIIKSSVNSLLESTRALNDEDIELISEFILDNPEFEITNIKSKNTAMNLIIKLKDIKLSKFISLYDVVKMADMMKTQRLENVYGYDKRKYKNKTYLTSSQRKLITKILDLKFDNISEIENVIKDNKPFRKKWSGLLHNIHYTGKNLSSRLFINVMRDNNTSKKFRTVMSEFISNINSGDIKSATDVISDKPSLLFRNLIFILNNCKSQEDVDYVKSKLSGMKNPIVVIQLLYYMEDLLNDGIKKRIFSFSKDGRVKTQIESDDSYRRRLDKFNKEYISEIKSEFHSILKSIYSNKLGKVFIDPEFYNMAIPMDRSTASTGFNTLPSGSVIDLKDKNLRFFTYWELVDDIDLSSILIHNDGSTSEVSWRANKDIYGVTYSGDNTRGYYGGTEYIDVDMDVINNSPEEIKYILLNNNVYSDKNFSDVLCTAGFMSLKDLDNSENFDPKNVNTSFLINSKSRYAHLFLVDVKNNKLIWLNVNRDSDINISGIDDKSNYLFKYINRVNVLNVGTLFELMAGEVVDNPDDADFILSNTLENSDLRISDSDKIIEYMNV